MIHREGVQIIWKFKMQSMLGKLSAASEAANYIVLFKMLTQNLCPTCHYPLYLHICMSRELVHFPRLSWALSAKISVYVYPENSSELYDCVVCFLILLPHTSKSRCMHLISVCSQTCVSVCVGRFPLTSEKYVWGCLCAFCAQVCLGLRVWASILTLVTMRAWANVSMGVSPWKAGYLYFRISRWQSSRLLKQYATSSVELVFVCVLLRMCVGDREETLGKIACAFLT